METGDDWQLTERVRASARSAKGDPFAAAVRATRMAMIITDPRRLDNPIAYANDAFLRLTGYTRLEVTGRNCRFLQGPETDLDEVARIRAAIDAEQDVRAELVNYRKDGSTFHNALYISPVHDADGTLLFFFASQFDATERRALAAERDTNALLLRAIGHRAGDDLRTVAAMLARRSEASADPAVRAALTDAIDRVEALGALYPAPAPDGGADHELAERLRAIAIARIAASGRDDIGLACDLASFPIRTDAAALIMPILNAAVADAVRRAPSAGRIALQLAREGEAVVVTIEGDGIGAAATDGDASADLIDALIHPIGGTCTRHPAGTAIELRFPAERLAD